MNQFRFFLLLLFLLSLYSCRQENSIDEVPLYSIKEKALSFTTDFPGYNLKTFQNKEGKLGIAFADLVTYKRILLYTQDGVKTADIDLKPIMEKYKTKLISYHVFSEDSILLLGKYTNHLFYIDGSGSLLHEQNFGELLLGGTELSTPVFEWKHNLYIGLLNFQSDTMVTDALYTPWGLFEHPKEHLVQIRPTEITPIRFLGGNLINRYLRPDQFNATGTCFLFNQEGLFHYSPFTDTVYQLTDSGIQPVVRLESNLGKIHLEANTRKDIQKDPNSVTKNYIENNVIIDMYADDKRELMYIFVRKPKESEGYFPFHLLIYDYDFQKLDEIPFEGKEYYLDAFVGEEGLYILRDFSENPLIKTFDLLTYEKP